jgi:hypothetical protein
MMDSNLHPMDGSAAIEDPDRLARRLMQRAWNRDGLPEIAIGLFFLMIAGLFAIQHHLERGWPIIRRIPLVMVPILVGAYLMQWAVKRTRNGCLVEKTGYVVFKPMSRKRRTLGILAAAIAGATAVAAVGLAARAHISSTSQWVLIGTGVIFGVLSPVCGRAWRFLFIGAVVAVTGILLGFYNVGFDPGWTIFYGVAGAVTLISGTIVLLRFLKQPPTAGV